MILIGSRAVMARCGENILKRPIDRSDYDIICTPQEFNEIIITLCESDTPHEYTENKRFPGKYGLKFGDFYFEIDATENQSNVELRKIVPEYALKTQVGPFTFRVPATTILYLTKRAHANFNVFFEKTLLDLVRMQKWLLEQECDLNAIHNAPIFRRYYESRHEEAKVRFGERQRRINLNVPNEKFFMQSSHCRQLDHDELHKLVAIDSKPAYLECKRDMSLAKLEKDMFFALPDSRKIRLPIEESLVIGMEREYIAKLKSLDDSFEVDEQTIYRKGLIKLVRDLSKGWFQDYCLDNMHMLWDHKESWYAKLHAQIAEIKLQEF